ncbi:MAG: GWxTD domain-containing protein [Bacteroidetes bacterium]|nr:GWxTD domain-containing protein [Bacteroidota bacterium]MCL2302189.1 GWxTD domain-containing protein [Lentimicrobiaceae bacterium]
MKKTILFTLILLLVCTTFAQKLSVLIAYKSYYDAATGEPYLEVSSFVNGKTVTYVANDQGKFEAEVRIVVHAFQGDSLVNRLNYILVSEKFEDSDASTKPNFGDVQNLQLSNGEYLLQFSVEDMRTDAKPLYYTDIAVLNYPQDNVSISDISLYRSVNREPRGDIFDKYGFSLEPLFYGFVPESMYNLPFSCEIYNTDKLAGNDDPITIKTYITCFENNLMPYSEARYTTQTKAKPVVVTLGEIGIFKLPSGNYNLIVDVFNKDSVLLATNSIFFQRSNPGITLNLDDIAAVNITNTFVDQIKDTMQLLEYVRFLYPISTPIEREFYTVRMKRISTESLRKFLYAFWVKRDPINPERAWTEYLEKVKHVNNVFGCKLVQGYRTDRGRVFLQYGPPNSIFESPYDSHSYPYEIWHYYYCVDQSNVKFVFYNTDLVSNDYELLHSDKRGEIHDPFWQIKITQRKAPLFNPDQRIPETYFGGNPKDDWFNHR